MQKPLIEPPSVLTRDLLALSLVEGIGARTINVFLEQALEIPLLFSSTEATLKSFGIGERVAKSLARSAHACLARANSIIDGCMNSGVDIIGIDSPLYPKLLKECSDAPPFLYVRGDARVLDNPYSISCVGTRGSTTRGVELVNKIISGAAQANLGVSVVSGLALGIDRFCHVSALENSLPTVAVLPGYVDDITPSSHYSLARRIVDSGGALISEQAPGSSIRRGNFHSRNRIIAGLSPATIMFQSPRKGGAMLTATMADGYDREVFAPPAHDDDPSFEGNLSLLKSSRANMLCSFEDIAQVMNWQSAPLDKTSTLEGQIEALDPLLLRVYGLLPNDSLFSLEMLCYWSDLSISEASSALLGLELKGLIASHKGRLFSKKL